MKNFTQVNRASSGAKKNFTQLESNLSCMAWFLHVIERRFSSADKLSGSRSERSLTSEETSIQHPLSIHSASIGHPLEVGGNQVATRSLFRIWKYVAMMALLLTLGIGEMWGASPLTWDAPDAISKTQDGVTILGNNTTGKMANNSSTKVLTTYNCASVSIYSLATNITSISFNVCQTGDGASASNAFDVYVSTGGTFTVPSSGFTATKDAASLASLSNISVNKGNMASATAITISFNSPVKAILLVKNSADIRVNNFSIAYNSATTPTTYFAAHYSGDDATTIDTNPGGASFTANTDGTNKTTISTKDFYKLVKDADQTVDLGTGNSFLAGDQIVFDIGGSGGYKSYGFSVKTSSGTVKATYDKGLVGNTYGSKFFYVVQTGDGIIGTHSMKFASTNNDGRYYSISVLRAASNTKPSSVSIGDQWLAFVGEPLTLTASLTGGSGDHTYQWYKGGTSDGYAIEGATSATYYKAEAEAGDADNYYCKVSTEGDDDVWSAAYKVQVLRLQLMWSNGTLVDDYTYHNFRSLGGNKATVSIPLEAYNYSFYIIDGFKACGNNGTIQRSNYTSTPWTHNVSNQRTGLNCDKAGTYIFTIDYSNYSSWQVSVGFPEDYYYKGNEDGWSSTHAMDVSCDGSYAYYWAKGKNSLNALDKGNNNNFLIVNSTGTSTLADGNKLEIRNGESSGFGGTDIWGTGHMGKWNGETNASIYNENDFYIIVFFPKTYVNTTSSPKICASTKLPDTGTTEDELVYFDNSESWSNVYYRIGHKGYNDAAAMTAVPGTARLYKMTTVAWAGYEAWNIANNKGNDGSHSIYDITTNTITGATNYFKCEDDGNITILLDGVHNTESGCTYYNVTTSQGLLTHTATVGATTNGSIRLNWKDINNAAQSATSTTAGLAHTCNLQVTGVPNTGYEIATLTVNGAAFTSGNTHVLAADATIAATFSLVNYNVTYSAPSNGNYTIQVASGSASSETKTATYGQTITLAASANTGYHFDSWTVTGATSGANITVTNNQFTMPAENVTVTATFAANTNTITLNRNGGSGANQQVTATYNSSTLSAAVTTPEKDGYNFRGWYTYSDGSGLQVINTSGNLNASVGTITGAGGIWVYDNNLTLYARWTQCEDYSFSYGTSGSQDWAAVCFSQVGETHEWRKTSFTIPNKPNFYVGKEEDFWSSSLGVGDTKSASYTTNWTTTYAQVSSIGNGAMQLLPAGASARAVGLATGAIGTLVIWDNTADKNLSVGFLPSGYGVTTADDTYAFTIGDGYFCYTDPVTISSTEASGNFQVKLATSSSYVACAQGTAENASAVSGRKISGDANIANGKKGVFQMWQNSTANNFGLRFVTVHDVSFNMQSHGDAIADYTNVRYNDKIVAPTAPTASGYTFGGWYKEPGCTNAWDFANDVVTAATTLYAKWTADDCSPTTLVKTVITGYSDSKFTKTTTGSYAGTSIIDLTSKSSQEADLDGDENNEKGYKMGSSGKKFYVQLSGTTLQEGDIIKVGITKANDNYKDPATTGTDAEKKKVLIICAWDGSVEGDSIGKITGVAGAGIYSYTVKASDLTRCGDSIHYVGLARNRWEQNPYMYSLEIVRPCVGTHSITYHCNDATSGCPDNATSQAALPNPLATPTKTNYTFGGWYTDAALSSAAVAGATLSANADLYAKWTQSVTLSTGTQGSGANKNLTAVWQATSLTGFTAHSADGYTLQGYYTTGSGGVKVLNADGTFAAANVTDYITSSKWSRTGAAPTLYAQWVAAEDCSTSDFVIKKGDDKEYQGCMESTSYDGTATSFTAGSPTTVGNAKMTISHYDGGIKRPSNGNTFSIVIEPVSGYYLKSICWAGKVENDETVYYYWDDNTASKVTISSQTTSGTGVTYDAPNSSTTKFTAYYVSDGDDSGGIWWRNVQVEVCAAGGTTYSVTYNGNDETSGSVPTGATNYSYGATVTVLDNTGSFAKTNYTFAGWTTNNNGTGSSYEAGNTFSITDNTTLYAKWTQSVTLNKNGGSTDGSATAVWNATGLTGITHAKPAAGYKLLGYYSTPSDGTKVLNSDGSFAATNVTGYITSGKWSRTSATTLYAEYESAGALTWNLIVNSDTTNLSTSTKTSAFTEISTTNMTNATLAGDLTYEKSKKSALTGKISTPASYDADDYVYVTFQVASGYKFTPSSIKVIAQPVTTGKDVKLSLTDGASHSLVSSSATSISGGSTQTVTLAGNGTYFTGTVTLKIYCYGATDKYRLGTPITIEGEVEEACATMPSYTRMSYTTTTFAPGDDASGSPITIVGGENIDTYQWKYNKVNDRTSGTNCGTGTSLSPLTDEDAATDGTRYYWCEMTNDACGITIKSPAVAITVAAAKSDATVEWTDPASTPNYGGGGYTVKATVDQTGWDGNAADLVITAPAGIRIYNVTSGTTSSKKWVQADFDVQTSFDRTTYASNIPFTVSAAATATYNAISDDHNVSYSACSGGGGGSSYNIRVRKSYDKDASNNYRWVTPGAGEITYAVGSSISSGKAGTAMATYFDSIMSSDKQYIWVKTFVGNIKQMRLYVETSGANISVSALYQRTTYAAADAKDVITGYSVVYDEDDDAENTGTKGQHTIDLIFTSALSANDIICVKFSSSKVKALGAAITEGSAGSLNTYLQWSGDLLDDATVDKNTTDAYFTYSASKITENTNTLGAITYSSSDPSVATVDATGKVALVAAGSTTIKATLAASGCYKKAEISYTLNVTEVACAITAGTLTLTSGTESKCSGDDVTLTLTGFESGASIQWKDGDTNINNGGNYTIATDGTTSTLTTDQEGTYSVMVTKDCSVRSNRITISNKSTEVGAKRIVKNWYIKNGRPTPDIELWTLQNGAHLSSVAWDPVNATGLTASDFYESDGKVYLKGKEPSSNTSEEDINYTLTLTVADDCGSTTEMSASGQLIYLHHQKNTDKHVLAFVVTGTEKGGFTDGITAEQTTGVELYNTIAANFDVLATNVYSTDDEQALKEYYSQFDILCVTDYPNTGTKGVNKKSYVDALGALVDIRPILTMEAFVAKLANWKAKGISGTPQSPTTRQYTMLLQCKDHEIFSGTKLTKVGEGDETMYRVSMVDNTLEDYVTLDATYGGGEHAEKSGYEYGSKPALQGFTFTKEMLDDDLLPLGLIDDGSGNDLQVGIERQTEMEARLMVLGINSYAMERLTDDGQIVVVNALKYLMKKNSEDIADCSNTFVGGDDEEDVSTRYNWDVASHWSGNAVPDRTQKVRIVAPCVIPANVKPHVAGVIIAPSGKYNHGANTASGSLTIAAGGALIVDGKVEAATAPHYTEIRATSPSDLILQTNSTAQSALIFDNDKGETQATVNFYSLGRNEGAFQYQYIASPMEVVPVSESYAGTGVYTYVYTEAGGWERRGYYTDLYAFEGVAITTRSATATEYTVSGTLAHTNEREIDITVENGGDNMIGNSWTAPIQISELSKAPNTATLESSTVYVYCSGRDAVEGTGASGTTETAGQWLAIPFDAAGFAGWSGLKVIPAMNAFEFLATAAGTITLNYDTLVRGGSQYDLTAKARAPKRIVAHEGIDLVRIRVADTKTHNDIHLFEGDVFSEAFDDGWEAKYMTGEGISAQLYAMNGEDKMAVLATSTLEGTVLGFAPGREREYTFSFLGADNGYYLNDLKLKTSTPISETEHYTFTYEEGDTHRFYISKTRIDAPQTPTDVTNPEVETPKAQKFIYKDKMYIMINGRVYSAEGALVK